MALAGGGGMRDVMARRRRDAGGMAWACMSHAKGVHAIGSPCDLTA